MIRFNIASLLLLVSFIREAASHGYITSPRSRNFIAGIDGVWSGGGADTYPKDSCAHCANRGGTMGECGYTGNYYYDVPRSILGNVMPADPQAVYAQGAVIDVEVVLTAHHMGHFEFYACPIQHGQAPTSSCFQQYPLEFVSDPLYGAVKDVNYPNRAYIAPRSYGLKQDSTLASGDFFSFKMKLPNNLQGDLVLLQWHYWTANSCKYAGYTSYPFPSAWGNMQNGLGICGPNPDGNGLPEQFWNCAEIKIVGGPASSPVPDIYLVNPAPTPVPTSKAPVPASPVITPTSSSTGTCGNGSVGNGKCANSNLCCSAYGWCGTTSSHCSSQSTPAPVPLPTSAPVPSPTRAPTPAPTRTPVVTPTVSGTCGNGSVGNGKCANSNLCCSAYGWCGTTSAHCSSQSTPAPVPSPTPPPTPSPVVTSTGSGTCGNGSVGNGKCADTSQCCSKWGWCGQTATHCSTT